MLKRNFAIPSLLAIMLLAGCAARVMHPGAVNSFDSQSYDFLIATHAIIEQTRVGLANNSFPANIAVGVKKAVNDLIIAYNVADTTYQAYHTAAVAGTATPAQQANVSTQLNQVSAATTALTNAKVGK